MRPLICPFAFSVQDLKDFVPFADRKIDRCAIRNQSTGAWTPYLTCLGCRDKKCHVFGQCPQIE